MDIIYDAPVPFEKQLKAEYLIGGYSRENSKKSSLIPSSVRDLISYYFPSMNGHSFLWCINKDNNLSSSIDSDAFDIGLPNKFFLRLETNICAMQQSDSLLSGGRGMHMTELLHTRLNHNGKREHFVNNVNYGSLPRSHPTTQSKFAPVHHHFHRAAYAKFMS